MFPGLSAAMLDIELMVIRRAQIWNFFFLGGGLIEMLLESFQLGTKIEFFQIEMDHINVQDWEKKKNTHE